jgi:hypothetical protein
VGAGYVLWIHGADIQFFTVIELKPILATSHRASEKHHGMDLTPEQRIAKHKDFLNANWTGIAAFAWEHYLVKGKGMVLVEEEDFVFAKTPQYAPLRFRYLPVNDPAIKEFPDWEGSKEQSWIKSYDPAERVIVVVSRFDSNISSYYLGARPSPPDAYALMQAGNN